MNVLVVDLTTGDDVHSPEADALENEIMDFLHGLDLESCDLPNCRRCKPSQPKLMN